MNSNAIHFSRIYVRCDVRRSRLSRFARFTGAPKLTRVTGYSEGAIPWLLVLFGVGLFAGNLIGGRWADRNLTRTLVTLTLALGITMVTFALLTDSKIASAALLLAMGFFGFGATPGLQMRVLDHASAAPTMASSANIAAFNVGNFLGVWISGLTISAGLGWVSPLWVGAGFAVIGLAVLALATRDERANQQPDVRSTEPELVAS